MLVAENAWSVYNGDITVIVTVILQTSLRYSVLSMNFPWHIFISTLLSNQNFRIRISRKDGFLFLSFMDFELTFSTSLRTWWYSRWRLKKLKVILKLQTLPIGHVRLFFIQQRKNTKRLPIIFEKSSRLISI